MTAIKPRSHAVNPTAEVQSFRVQQSALATQIAIVEGRAMICGHDPIAGRDFTITMTRFYVDRRPVEDGFAPADDDPFTFDLSDTKE